MSPITGTKVRKKVGPTTYVGRRWRFPLHMPFSEDTTAAANTFRARNADKMLECDVYLGVPYAQHPEGRLRWRAPQPFTGRAAEVDCSRFPDVPFQSYPEEGPGQGRNEFGRERGAYDWASYPGGICKESERIAYYHLFIPTGTPPEGGWPVVDWQHGGGWGVNAAGQYFYLAHRLAAIHGVAVRLPEYPLSSFGWAHLEEWATEPDYIGPDLALEFLRVFAARAHQDAPEWGLSQTRTVYSGSSAGGAGTLAMMEIPVTAALYRAFWVSSGGGAGERYAAEPSRGNVGYKALWANFRQVVETAAPYIKDASGRHATLQGLIDDIGIAQALRIGLTPEHVMALADARERLTDFAGAIRAVYRGTMNAFPFADGVTLKHRSSTAAARAGALAAKPMVIAAAGNESSLYGVQTSSQTAAINPHAFAKLLGYAGDAHLRSQPWMAGLTDREYLRRLGGMALFEAPAYATAHAHAAAGHPAYLMHWNYKSQGNEAHYAGHSSDNPFILGNPNWAVYLTADGRERIHERDLQMTWLMGHSIAALAYTGDPAGAYTWAGDPAPFAAPPSDRLTAFSTAACNTNVVGSMEEGVITDAPATIQNVPGFRQAQMEAYRTRVVS